MVFAGAAVGLPRTLPTEKDRVPEGPTVNVLPATDDNGPPRRRTPEFTSMPPVKVLLPERVRLPDPFWTILPVPEMALAGVMASLRLKASVALLTTLPVPRVPEAPPLPTW